MSAAPALRCPTRGCRGTVLADGYCDTCGAKGVAPATAAAKTPAKAAGATKAAPATTTGGQGETASSRALSVVTGSARAAGSRRSTRTTSRLTTGRHSTLGAGIVTVPPAPAVDPQSVVLADPRVGEDHRWCSKCGAPVGRSKNGRAGRSKGYCSRCRQPFDFTPGLAAGDVVGGQYAIVGCLAHGGLGWIYLAQDRAVDDRWVVLKGVLDAGDEAATAAALAERRFLAQVQHPNIVDIFNFVAYRGSGYIVEAYVGGRSLTQLLKDRREANGGHVDPLPPEQAIAFMLAALPALGYLHGHGLVYCDFKPDNVVQVGDDIKLVDLGAVRRLDDTTGDVYGTQGFQAPEIATLGPSVVSDLYTVGRALAVLILDFRGYQSTYEFSLPDPADQPVLARFPSLYRFLLKATASHPDDRFQSAEEMSDQLLGVLRGVVAVTTGTPQPGPSAVFSAPPAGGGLPSLAVDPADPAAAVLANLSNDPAAALATIHDALAAHQITETNEVRLRQARAELDAGDTNAAAAALDTIEAQDPWEWRAAWLRGVSALAAGDLAAADQAFERCMYEVPGELAPVLAAADTAARQGDTARAAPLYDVVSRVDPSWVGAATGLAACRLAAGDLDGALEAYGRVPATHRAHAEAQTAAARALLHAGRYSEASDIVAGLDVDAQRRAELTVEVLEAALAGPRAGGNVFGHPVTEPALRRALDHAYRTLAAMTADRGERTRLVDRANRVRPVTLV